MTQFDDTFELPASDGSLLTAYCWRAQGPCRAVVFIAHGMGEHARRYGRFARFLNGAGVTVYGFDQRGHGEATRAKGMLGHFSDERGWELAVADIAALGRYVAAEHPGVKRIFFGHSMGSMLGQEYLISHGDEVDAAILSGTGGGQGALLLAARAVAAIEKKRLGGQSMSPVLDRLTFGDYNRAFKPTRTDYDWLSRDPVEVDTYIADPLCGATLTTQSWGDMFCGLRRIEDAKRQAQVPKSLPIYIFSGDRDPVGQNGKGPSWLTKRYNRAGLFDVELRLYPEGRHEMLNEINHGEVQDDLLVFVNRVVGA